MPKNAPAVNSEPAQPLLPTINLARFLTDTANECDCDCNECPPWSHSRGECAGRCERPPSSNTGVHTTRGSAAASFWQRRVTDTRCDEE